MKHTDSESAAKNGAFRICHVVPDLDRIGGYEAQARSLARYQRENLGYETHLLTHRNSHLPAQEDTAAGTVHRLSRGLRIFHPSRWWRRNASRFDFVHAHAVHKLSGQLIALAHRGGIPTLVKVATQCDLNLFARPENEPTAPRSPRRRHDMRAAFAHLRQADAFIALNPAISAEIRSHGLLDFAGSNGVDTDYFRPPSDNERRKARRALGLAPNAPCVAYVGRLVSRKDLPCLIAACTRLKARKFPFQAVLAGDGPERSNLEGLVRQAGLYEQFSFIGETDRVRDILWAANLFVNPSRREGLPNAVLEGWSCAHHTLLSDIAGHSEHPRAVARLFTPGDSKDLAQQIISLLDRGRESVSCSAARSYALNRFTLASVAARYDAIYRRLEAGLPIA